MGLLKLEQNPFFIKSLCRGLLSHPCKGLQASSNIRNSAIHNAVLVQNVFKHGMH